MLATFDGPTRAIRCAEELCGDARSSGLKTRTGIHTGECMLMEHDVGGIAVHVASRVLDECGPDEVLVTSTVKDLVFGSGVSFDERGLHSLKGIADEWHLYALRSAAQQKNTNS
jgi:class 3 adenylate cyclase